MAIGSPRFGQRAEVSEREGAPGRPGTALVEAVREVLGARRAHLEGGHELARLKAELLPLRERIRRLLKQGERGRHLKTANFCAGLLEEFEALWTFCEIPRSSRRTTPASGRSAMP